MEKDNYDIAIIGAGLTGLSLAYYLTKANKKVILLDKNGQVGGVIQTVSKEGFTYEIGPNSGSMSTEEIAVLFNEIQTDNCQLEIAGDSSNARWIWKNNKWNALPSGLISGIKTPLFSWKDKFRLLAEPWRKPSTNPDESIADLVKHRLGKSFLDYAVNPFIGGIYAGDPTKLVTRFALPKLYHLEQTYGSFIGGSIKLKKERAKFPKNEIFAKVKGRIFSTKGGLKSLIFALKDKIGDNNILLETTDLQINTKEKSYTISFNKNGEKIILETKQVVTTCGSYALPSLLPFLSKKELEPITNLRYAKVIQVLAAYKNWKGIDLDAFGGLIPAIEKRNTLGVLFPSSIFSNRAPKGGALLSVFMGGMNKPEFIDKSDVELKALVKTEIKEILAQNEEADFIEIYRYPSAIAQYELNSKERFETINKIEQQYAGLHIAGSLRDGIGMADRVRQAKNIANKIIENNG